MNTDTMTHRKRVRDFRKQRGYSQVKLATMAGVSASLVQKIESGEQELSFRTARKLANALEVAFDDIWVGEEARLTQTAHDGDYYPRMTGALESTVDVLLGYLQLIREDSTGNAQYFSNQALEMYDHLKEKVIDKIEKGE